MTNTLFLAGLQLNDSVVNCNFTRYSVKKQYNNYNKGRYKKLKPSIFPVSGGDESYEFELVLWVRGNNWQNLINKENLIFNQINDNVLSGNPIELFCADLPVYLNYNTVALRFNSVNLIRRGTDGKNFISLTFDGLVEEGL